MKCEVEAINLEIAELYSAKDALYTQQPYPEFFSRFENINFFYLKEKEAIERWTVPRGGWHILSNLY